VEKEGGLGNRKQNREIPKLIACLNLAPCNVPVFGYMLLSEYK
jgi:hypothetical protein